ncbi:DUF4065 domain-containing protein [Clostridium niameyense]|uniref:DUF4065 domain-containing protein n=1 Tax=Clostridium niameyense TaxID=1622073 RepID=A0A6M0RCJ3_9CLOT|nr:type II toxin-antitoxin system antitoxin SocA domain-containing protein [Clostridium niameyense]NEZ47944.1 DUF4065 domain-containing protein [Clostridium niameyense]
MIYNVLDVCRLIINYCAEKRHPISNIKLQKILYYVQAAFLVEKKKICFEEKILNWTYGPVVEEAYREFRIYGGQNIPKQEEYNTISYNSIDSKIHFSKETFDESKFCEDDEKIIKKIVDLYIDKEPFYLVKKTHKEDPWLNTSQNEVISIESIRKYYEENLNLLYEKD